VRDWGGLERTGRLVGPVVGSNVKAGVMNYKKYAHGCKRRIIRYSPVVLGLYIMVCTAYTVRPSGAKYNNTI
jgi:hypothetical protein